MFFLGSSRDTLKLSSDYLTSFELVRRSFRLGRLALYFKWSIRAP